MPKAGSEKALRRQLKAAIESYDKDAHVVQVENATAGAGTPDTYLCVKGMGAWLELKFIHAPKRSRTPIRLDHLRDKQVHWMAREWRAGGYAWVMLQASKYYMLLSPKTALEIRARRHTLASAWNASVWSSTRLKQDVDGLLSACFI